MKNPNARPNRAGCACANTAADALPPRRGCSTRARLDITTGKTANRPDVNGPIEILNHVDEWFDTSVFAPVARFGNLGRNVIIGPTFNNTDFSIIKNTKLGETSRLQMRAEIFDVFNHANFGQPGNVAGSPSFGRITNTRFPTGESGSSRQIQFGLRLII